MSWLRRVGVGVMTSLSLACGGAMAIDQSPAPRAERRAKPGPDQGSDPRSVLALYTQGDVNEDGKVDQADLDLITKLVDDQPAAEATCAAAADLDLDGTVTAKDCSKLAARLESGPIVGAPLFSQPRLPCSFKNLQFGATAELFPNEPTQIRFYGGLTTETVEASADGPVELVPAQDGRGFEVLGAESVLPGSSVVIRLFTGTLVRTLTLTKQAQTDDEAQDHGDDPRDLPPPVIFGEEIEGQVCANADKGCVALVIDFDKATWYEDADHTLDALRGIRCNVAYAAPDFRRLPQVGKWVVTRNGMQVEVDDPVDLLAVTRVKEHNRAERKKVRDAIAAHRAALAGGANLALQVVTGHVSSYRCGTWGPEFSTGTGWLGRASFHQGNWRAARGAVCNTMAMDWACYGGLTAKAIDAVNNSGVAQCQTPAPITHGWHAGFFSDRALSLASASTTSSNGAVGSEDDELSEVIESSGAAGDYDAVLQAIRTRVHDTAGDATYNGFYSDKGYNHAPGAMCTDDAHVKSY